MQQCPLPVADPAVTCSTRKATLLINVSMRFTRVWRLLGWLVLLGGHGMLHKASMAVAVEPAVEVPLPYGDLRNKPAPKGYVACRCTDGLVIDGHLNEPCWAAAAWTDDFVDIVGPTGPAPWFATRAKMLWDDNALYIAAYMDEPKAFAQQTLHDSIIFQDNDFEIFIDPDGDNHMYYEIEINALGHIWDLLLVNPYRNGGPPVMNWESIQPRVETQHDGPTGWTPLSAAVHIEGAVNAAAGSTSWTVEFALPWSLLRRAANRQVPPAAGDQWRINFSRVQYNVTWDAQQKAYAKDPPNQPGYNWVWTPQWQVAMHQPETWGYLQFGSSAVPRAEYQDRGSAEAPQPDYQDRSSTAVPQPDYQAHDSVALAQPDFQSRDSADMPRPDHQDLDSQLSCTAVAERFRPDVTWPARALLMDIYFAQTVCWQEHHHFCKSMEEMSITDVTPDLAANLKVEVTSASFVASTLVNLHNDAVAVSVDQTGRLVQYPADATVGDSGAFDPFVGNSIWVPSERALQPRTKSSSNPVEKALTI